MHTGLLGLDALALSAMLRRCSEASRVASCGRARFAASPLTPPARRRFLGATRTTERSPLGSSGSRACMTTFVALGDVLQHFLTDSAPLGPFRRRTTFGEQGWPTSGERRSRESP